MTKITFACIIVLCALGSSSLAQNIIIPADIIPTLLCKKWKVDHAVMGGMNIGGIPGAPEINYEFNKDKTFILTSSDPKEKKKGSWNYDPKKKVIRLTVDGKSISSIVSLKEGELVMVPDMGSATADDGMEIKLVYKVRTS